MASLTPRQDFVTPRNFPALPRLRSKYIAGFARDDYYLPVSYVKEYGVVIA
jgi:hypothetical protein